MTLAVAALLGLAAWVLVSPPADPRIAALLPRAAPSAGRAVDRHAVAWAGAVTAAVGSFAALSSPINVVGAVACLLLLPRFLGRLESRADRRRSEALSRQAPVVADLLAATRSSGAPMRHALYAVGAAVEDPVSTCLHDVVRRLDLGADPDDAWRQLSEEPSMGVIAVAAVRSSRTGAPLAAALTRLADDLRRDRRSVVEVAARTAGVRAVVPLAACFLPAFILVGVVPVVAALATSLLDG